MIHPLFRLLVSEPQMLADHVEAYAELVAEEAGAVANRIKRRLLMQAISVFAVIFAVFLAAIALMLWAVVPTESMRAPWMLIVVPGVPAILAIGCYFGAKKPAEDSRGMKAIREQMAADAEMLRSVGAQT
ncbi:MAG: hypothetical protein ACJ8G7_23275 [Rhizobacter sp.]